MELEKNGDGEKSFLGVLVFGHPYCLSINSSEFNVEHENTCSFPCHIGISIPTFRDIIAIVRKKIVLHNFLYKVHHISKKFKFLRRRTAIKVSFSFYFFTIP